MEPQQGTVLRLHGELDEERCAAVRAELAPKLAEGLRHLVLDLSDVTGIAVPGLRMLRSLDRHLRAQQGGLVVLRPSEDVRATLRVYDLEHLLEVRDAPPGRQRPAATRPERVPDRMAGVVPLVRRA